MKTIKVIDLLNKIANGEEVPKTLKYDKKVWKYEESCQDYSYIKNGILEKYLLQDIMSGIDSTINCLNDKAEIIEEEKEIEKIISFDGDKAIITIVNKLNEVIRVLNKLNKK